MIFKSKKEIGELVKSKKEWVSEVKYTSGDEAWKKFKEDSEMGAEYDDVYMDDNPLADFDSYCEIHERVAAAYQDKKGWAQKVLRNIAHAGKFSSDRTIEDYVRDIWKLEKIVQ